MVRVFRMLTLLFLSTMVFGCAGSDDENISLSGYVILQDETPFEGVEIGISVIPDGDEVTVVTDEEGWYSYEFSSEDWDSSIGSAIIQPSSAGYSFDPPQYIRSNYDGGSENLDFVATPVD